MMKEWLMKNLLNIVVVSVFASMSFVALASQNDSTKGFWDSPSRMAGTMLEEHPMKTIAGVGLLGTDIMRQIRGKVPTNMVEIVYNGVSKQWMRQRNVAAFLLGYTFYKTAMDRDRVTKDHLHNEWVKWVEKHGSEQL
jgi:hypothetical protein